MAFTANIQEAALSSFSISEDLSAKQWHIVKIGATDGSVLLADTAGTYVPGILFDVGLDGSSDVVHGRVVIQGESMLKIGGNISAGNPIQADTDGMGIVSTTADLTFCRALEGGVDGDVIRVILGSEGIF